MREQVILAVDPGSRYTGLALAVAGRPVAFETVAANASAALTERVNLMFDHGLDFLLSHRPELRYGESLTLVVEWPSFMQGRPGQRTIYLVAGAFVGLGNMLRRLYGCPLDVDLVDPSTWKAQIIGSASADKAQIQAVLRARYQDEFSKDPHFQSITLDGYDALGILCWQLQAEKLAQVIAGGRKGKDNA